MTTAKQVTSPPRGNGYPTTDGKLMAETDTHRRLMNELIDRLSVWFSAREDVYISGNLLVFYSEGDRRRHVAPDVFVVRGVPRGDRINYLIWEEGHAPEVVVEFTSSSTRHEDTGPKLELYRDTIRVREYFLFDPFGDYLEPSLRGYRLRGGRYVQIHPVEGRFPSQVLGLHLERVNQWLRLYDPETGDHVPTQAELQQQAREAEHDRAEAERQAREAAERRNVELMRELERLRSGTTPPTT